MEATEIALTLAENIDQLDGHEAWKPVDPDTWGHCNLCQFSTVYIEVRDTETGEAGQIYLLAARKPVEPPTFDDGAGDRAHDDRVADELGSL
jgi:hypothetical protein